MPDKSRGQPLFFKIGRLEGKQHQEMIKKAGDICRPTGSIGPDGRANIMNQWNTVASQPPTDTKIKIWGIYRNDDIRPGPLCIVGGLANSAQQFRDMGNDFHKPHETEFLHWKQAR